MTMASFAEDYEAYLANLKQQQAGIESAKDAILQDIELMPASARLEIAGPCNGPPSFKA